MNGPITEGRDHWNPDAPYYSPSLSFERAIPPVPTNGYLLHSPQADQNPSLEAAPQLQLPRRLVGKLNICNFLIPNTLMIHKAFLSSDDHTSQRSSSTGLILQNMIGEMIIYLSLSWNLCPIVWNLHISCMLGNRS